jgi:hypothetical protein
MPKVALSNHVNPVNWNYSGPVFEAKMVDIEDHPRPQAQARTALTVELGMWTRMIEARLVGIP